VGRVVFHIDVNSAYLSWEAAWRLQHGDPVDLRERLAVVGGDEEKRHGIVLAKSIPAKRLGVKTGETLVEARRKAPGLIVVPPHYDLYMACSGAMRGMLHEYSPSVQQFSIDEMFLEYTGAERLYGPPVQAANGLRERIKGELGFTVNIGISENKLLAKMASEFQKPDRVHTLWEREIPEKMWRLPIGELFMVGLRTEIKLRRRGIETIGQLAALGADTLEGWFGKYGGMLWQYANGQEASEVGAWTPVKGFGNSATIPFDVTDSIEVERILLALVETVALRLRAHGSCARLVSVFGRSRDFRGFQRQHMFSTPTDATGEIHRRAVRLFREIWAGQPLRHMGVRVSELVSNDFWQCSLFEKDRDRERALDRAVDILRARYGAGAVFRSCFLHSGISPLMGGVSGEDDYPMMKSML
jgi:DNA polymerase-4